MKLSIIRLSALLFLIFLNDLMSLRLHAKEALQPSIFIEGIGETEGIKGTIEDAIRSTTNLLGYDCDLPDWRLKRLGKSTRKNATQILRALGYYHPEIKLETGREKNCWSMKLTIELGQQVVIRKLDVSVTGELAEIKAYRTFKNNLLLKTGQSLKHADYEKTKTEIETLASQYGFFEGQFTQHRLAVEPSKNAADIQLKFESGPRYHIGKLSIEQHQFNDELIQKYLKITEGKPYNSRDLTKQQQVLNDSGYFSSVEITAWREPNSEHKVPISIQLMERKKNAFRIGVGASTNEGPRTSFSYENRWANRRGHHYILDTRWSPVIAEAAFNYSIPLGDSGGHRLELGLGYQRESTETTESTALKSGAKLIRILANDWKRTISLEVLREKFQTGNDDDKVTLLMPGIGWNKNKRDRLKLPRKGWRLSTNFKTAFEDALSDINVAQLSGSAKLIRPLGKGRVLANVSAGFTEVSQFSRLPVSLRFYAGGDNSVRGFGYKTLGPKNEDGEVTGGKHKLTGSLEYEHPVKENWGLAVFVDTGNAFNDFNDYDLQTGAGFGMRYHSPIGPIRLDVAQDTEGEASIRLHLSMGPDL